ncbi:hypothetical protein DFH09DRAFT_1160351 [Mycena vulgaris]|nr:hypothetical protein DFH09DRAFT_1160351 [Mycena vulgaris]
MASPGTTHADAPPGVDGAPEPMRNDDSSILDAAFKPVGLPGSQAKIAKFQDNISGPIGKAHDAYETLNNFYNAHEAAINSAARGLNLQSIESSITTFAHTSELLMEGLNVLAQVHPFVGVAVLAFKGVIMFDIARRQNNRKVLAVKIQLQDTMVILFRLREMRDPENKGRDGKTLTDRFQGLMVAIATDIDSCGSACDVYDRKSLLAKTIKSKIYEDQLAGYVTKFTDYKKDIEFELLMHTALGVDQVSRKLDGQDEVLRSIQKEVQALFRKLDTQRERDMRKIIDDKGGAKACIDDDSTLQDLVAKSSESLSAMDLTHAGEGDLASLKRALNKELLEDVDEAFQKNMTPFKFKLDMIIGELSNKEHEKIEDKDLKAIWQEQGWKGSVPAQHFVLALNDYCTKFGSDGPTAAGSASASSILTSTSPAGPPADADSTEDRWTLVYINLAHLQPILEAVDDDGSGFVSIKEANDFATSRPPGWSLLSWVAFWAAGWHISVTWYKNRIYKILAGMLSLVKGIKPANVNAANMYLRGLAMQRVELLLRSTRSAPGTAYQDPQLKRFTDAFQNMEEEKLKQQLNGLSYVVDDIATVRLITGPRRIDRYVYPLLFGLLKRHYDIMRLAQIHILDESEWVVMNKSLAAVFEVVAERARTLEAIFKSNSIDVKERLGNLAFGMFGLLYGDYDHDPINNSVSSFVEEDGYSDDDEDLGPRSDDDEETTKTILARMDTSVLRHKTQKEPVRVDDFESSHHTPALCVDPLDGVWTGQIHTIKNGEITAFEGTLSMVLKRAGDKLSGEAESFLGALEVEGKVSEENQIVITISWPDGYALVCSGQYDPQRETIIGECWDAHDDDDSSSGSDESSSSGDESDGTGATHEDEAEGEETSAFIFSRTPATVFRFRYTEAQFKTNPPTARWRFAIAAMRDEAQRTYDPWTYLMKRFAESRRFIELDTRAEIEDQELTPGKPLSAVERTEFYRLRADLRSCDSRFYHSVVLFQLRCLPDHHCGCNSCHRSIRGARLFCLQCDDQSWGKNIDLCIECAEQTPSWNQYVHTRSHVLVKTRRCLHHAELAQIVQKARVIVDRVKTSFARVEGAKAVTEDRHASKNKSAEAKKICCCCRKPVLCPCWVCITCTVKHTYICEDCDAKGAFALKDGRSPQHKLNHPLVQIRDSKPIPPPPTTDSRLSNLETKILALDSKMAAVESRFGSLEVLLQGMAEKLSNQS